MCKFIYMYICEFINFIYQCDVKDVDNSLCFSGKYEYRKLDGFSVSAS